MIEPYYRDEAVTLYHGDSLGESGLGTLPDLSVDVAIVDPPYSAHVHAKSVRGGYNVKRARELGFESLQPESRALWSFHLARLVKRWVLVFCDVEGAHEWIANLQGAGLEYIRTGFWHKLGATPQVTGDRPGSHAEAIVIAHRPGRKRWNGGGLGNVWSYPTAHRAGETVVNETQKPEGLIAELVEKFSDPDELVLDFCAGSGTLPRKAKDAGRRAICWEVREEQCRFIAARMAQTVFNFGEQGSLI